MLLTVYLWATLVLFVLGAYGNARNIAKNTFTPATPGIAAVALVINIALLVLVVVLVTV